MVCNQSLGTQIAMLQYTVADGWTKGANEKSYGFIHQHGGYDVMWKPPLVFMGGHKYWLLKLHNSLLAQ